VNDSFNLDTIPFDVEGIIDEMSDDEIEQIRTEPELSVESITGPNVGPSARHRGKNRQLK
jgi:hypothetical protein